MEKLSQQDARYVMSYKSIYFLSMNSLQSIVISPYGCQSQPSKRFLGKPNQALKLIRVFAFFPSTGSSCILQVVVIMYAFIGWLDTSLGHEEAVCKLTFFLEEDSVGLRLHFY